MSLNMISRLIKQYLAQLNPQLLTTIEYFYTFKRMLNWKKPQDLNEKINWLKFYSDTSLWTRLADKYAVRTYVKECGFEDCLVKLYGKWDNEQDIDWEKLPCKFVMKVNNGSGDVLVCKDKNNLNIPETSQRFGLLLKKNFSNYNGEPHYRDIKPCIIAEELLDSRKQPVPVETLIDYKIWCFHGVPHHVWACHNRRKGSVEVATYDLNWNRHDEYSIFTPHYKRAEITLPKPKSLNRMLEIAAALSKGIPQVRVDMYEVDGKPYFGEMTFTSAGGFMNFYTQ